MWIGFKDRILLSKGDARSPDGKFALPTNDSGIGHKGAGKIDMQAAIHGHAGCAFDGEMQKAEPHAAAPRQSPVVVAPPKPKPLPKQPTPKPIPNAGIPPAKSPTAPEVPAKPLMPIGHGTMPGHMPAQSGPSQPVDTAPPSAAGSQDKPPIAAKPPAKPKPEVDKDPDDDDARLADEPAEGAYSGSWSVPGTDEHGDARDNYKKKPGQAS